VELRLAGKTRRQRQRESKVKESGRGAVRTAQTIEKQRNWAKRENRGALRKEMNEWL
jgi:hypothetical protein